MIASVFLCCAALSVPDVIVDRDNVVIKESCRIVIPPGTVIRDSDDNGVLHIDADNITVEFAPESVLVGSSNLIDRDALTGCGIRIHARSKVTLKNLNIRGYKVGLWADETVALVIEKADLRNLFSRRLLSTPEAEDASDWFYPHHNDERPWRVEYGGAIVIERSREPVIRDVTVRQGQNGIILDRVFGSQIYDNDCSFLSGWGLAMWRSNNNMISRNAFDFCIRGYSHGIYNRGQDSAGILMFEQCSQNTIIENSATHGGDGIFGFAGREAIGEVTTPGMNHAGLGCNDNYFIGNDLSYAAAHGFEMTFSHRNVLSKNRLVENAICGIWGGYSQDMVIFDNQFLSNGDAGYGLERGAINIEHGSGNQISSNSFSKNSVAIHLWWDDDKKLLELPGIKPTYRGVSDNMIADNTSSNDDVFVRIRDAAAGGHVHNLSAIDNKIIGLGKHYELPADVQLGTIDTRKLPVIPLIQPVGNRKPVGARPELRGRDKIIMTQWEPWDHASPLVRVRPVGTSHVLVDTLKPAGDNRDVSIRPTIKTTGEVSVETTDGAAVQKYRISPKNKSQLTPYTVEAALGNCNETRAGILLDTQWSLTFFTWDKQTDPRENLEAWQKLANAPSAISAKTNTLSLTFSHGGPRSLKLSDELTKNGPGNDHFGMLASTTITIPKGDWRFITTSDDGIRVKINGKPLIENWTWHAPTRNEAVFHQNVASDALIEIEYFEIDGFAVLDLEISPAAK